MLIKNNILEHPVVSAVISALIVMLVDWFVESISIWEWLKKILFAEMPLWSILLICSLVLTIMWKVLNKHRNKNLIKPKFKINEITPEEHKLLTLLKAKDGSNVHVTNIKNELDIAQLKSDQVINSLDKKGLIYMNLNYLDGNSIYLSPEGVNYVLSKKFNR